MTSSLFVLLAAPAAARAADSPKADLPLKRIVMFSSGVGFFERRGQVAENARVELNFRVGEVNDLLKSMVLQDLDGGRISTVTYGSKDPITKTLKTFAIDLTAKPTLAQLLDQIRGERVEIDAPDAITGIIVGIETRKQPGGKDNEPVEVEYLNLLTDKGLRSVSLQNVGRIKLVNEKLDSELRQALMILATGHDTQKKTVTLDFLGKGNRNVRVGYIQESPIWKTSYRLVLHDKQAPLLQGWAIVENTTDADWDKVDLTLVSGRPISFVMDLYQPLYLPRPVVQPDLFASLRPQTYDQDIEGREGEFRAKADAKEKAPDRSLARRRAGAERAAADAPAAAAPAPTEAFLREAKNEELDLGRGVQSAAQAADLGEMFQYKIAEPVTLGRQRSAMLPIVQQSVEAEKVSIYNTSVHAKHPLAGLRLKNSTELHLMQGPITVFDSGAYAGDARIQDLQPGSERLISYALDLPVEVAPESLPKPQQLVSVKLLKGLMHVTHKYERATTYTVKNSAEQKKKVLIEYAHDPSWKLIAPKEPAEKTRDLYRFVVDAEPGKPVKLAVEEERVVSTQIGLSNIPDDTIRIYLAAKEVSEKVKTALREVVKRKQSLAQIAAQRAELERQLASIRQQQDRIRENLKVLPKDSDLARTYIKKFTEQEQQLETLEAKITDAASREQTGRRELDEYLLALDVE